MPAGQSGTCKEPGRRPLAGWCPGPAGDEGDGTRPSSIRPGPGPAA